MKNQFFGYFAAVLGTIFVAPVHADPIAGYGQITPVTSTASAAQSPRATSTQRSRTSAEKNKANSNNAVIARSVSSRSTASRSTAQTSKNVVSRSSGSNAASSSRATSRAVRSRAGTIGATGSSARVSISSAAGTRVSVSGTSSTLASKLYTGTYSNIIDPTTGLISADAYSNCVESYYTCMDEICTARNPGQRRCACAGRVKTFANVEEQLQEAKEDLLKVSGQLSLLITTKGKDVTDAFTLTEAEKVLNCVSWRDAKTAGTEEEWCENHTLLSGTTSCSSYAGPPDFVSDYCSSEDFVLGGSDWMDVLNGSDSDILSGLETYADTINEVNVITADDSDSLWSSYMNVSDIVGELDGTGTITDLSSDTLATMWGYDLFAYAHNNVCNRVLNSCFNGIYEACGSHDGTTGPYNYNNTITIDNDSSDLTFVEASTSTTTSTATCFGYSSTSGDPYTTLRRPIADARRSILQKYALDANADCDTYGEKLKTQATNMAYQKIAATQYLQKKRLEFAQEEEEETAAELAGAKEYYRNCVNEIYDCYDQQTRSNPTWTVARIKNYCAQSAESPSCYETMICDQEVEVLIDLADNITCNYTYDWDNNTCRNIVLLSEILNGTGAAAVATGSEITANSAGLREYCLQETPGVYGAGSIRNFGVDWGPGF